MNLRVAKHKRNRLGKLTSAVTHIRLVEINPGKLEALDQLAQVYMALCHEYVTLFCTRQEPNKYSAPLFETPLSARWHRVAIQQAADIAHSWRTNRENVYQAYLEDLADYQEEQLSPHPNPKRKKPVWTEWNLPTVAKKDVSVDQSGARCYYPHKRSMVSGGSAEWSVTDLTQPLTNIFPDSSRRPRGDVGGNRSASPDPLYESELRPFCVMVGRSSRGDGED